MSLFFSQFMGMVESTHGLIGVDGRDVSSAQHLGTARCKSPLASCLWDCGSSGKDEVLQGGGFKSLFLLENDTLEDFEQICRFRSPGKYIGSSS